MGSRLYKYKIIITPTTATTATTEKRQNTLKDTKHIINKMMNQYLPTSIYVYILVYRYVMYNVLCEYKGA